MNKKNKLTIVILVTTILLLVILVAFFWILSLSNTDDVDDAAIDSSINIPTTLPSSSSGVDALPTAPIEEQNLEASIRAISLTFAERYGSYSNQSNFSNLKTLTGLMTDKMQAFSNDFISSQKVFSPTDLQDGVSYYGITTNALSVKVLSVDEDLGRAEVDIGTQRVETKITTNNPRTFYQTLKISLIDDGDGWKVDSATWL